MGHGRHSEELERLVERAGEVTDERDFLDRVGQLVQQSGDLLEPETAALAVLDEMDQAPDAENVAPSYAKMLAPEDLEPGLDGVIVEGKLLGMEPTRTFQRDDGSTGFVTDARIKGEQGIYTITMWDEHIQQLVDVDPGEFVRMVGLYTKEHRGDVELHTGRDAQVLVGDEAREA
jgi:ssDNA-binding replication factor A large subunit